MRMHAYRLAAALALAAVVCPQAARAQERDAPKAEVGVHFTTLELNPPDADGTATKPGFGGRFTYNFTDYFAVEAEGNFLPLQQFFGRTTQGQFGVKAGKRFNRFGLFAKARPGFVSFGEETVVRPVQGVDFEGRPAVFPEFTQGRRTHFSMDVGGVLEFYPSRRLVVRADAGDTIIRYGRRGGFAFDNSGVRFAEVAADTTHNFQLTAGVGFRFLDPGGAGGDPPAASSGGDRDAPRFEAGIQYTSLTLRPPSENSFGSPAFGSTTFTEPAVGGRFTFNFNDHLAAKAAVDFTTKENVSGLTYGGRAVSGQFGVKAGKRFGSWGVFGKARPGLLSYGEVIRLERIETVTLASGAQVQRGVFDFGRKNYLTVDLGGVLEFYPSRRLVTRFDFGDNLVRYTGRVSPGIVPAVFDLPDETRHNFQFNAGLGFRF